MQLVVDVPDKAERTLVPQARFKVLHGGRDSAKSTSVARYIIARCRARAERVLCTREVQKSLAESVHQLLKDQITDLGLDDFFEITNNYIKGENGSQISFHGLSGQTASSIKSYQGVTICWVEEAQTVTKRSWEILEPTIRAPGSEILVTFNPEMDTDATYVMFVTQDQPNSIVTQMNWEDNPWRSQVLDAAREKMLRDAPDDYAHIYGGECRPAVAGAIYYSEVSKLKSSGRLCNVPYDPMLKVHIVVDLGFNDFMAMLLVQRLGSEIRIIRYIEDRMRFIPSYHQELIDLKLNWGKLYLPHDGKAKHVTGSSAQEQFTTLGWDVEIVPDIGIEQGIRKTRELFARFYVDKTEAGELVNRLGRYRRRVNTDGQASVPLHDDNSNGADGTRYLAIVADQLTNDSNAVTDPYRAFRRNG